MQDYRLKKHAKNLISRTIQFWSLSTRLAANGTPSSTAEAQKSERDGADNGQVAQSDFLVTMSGHRLLQLTSVLPMTSRGTLVITSCE
ncbi:MAG TPA: hypothetical protein VFE96_02690 [Candidatus Bathyarchaeia archaeon]|nr:hypothetical protein [Candidatus Bathyarchaeia archaeon]